MIETLTKMAEVAKTAAESPIDMKIDPDARIEAENLGPETNSMPEIDPDARIDAGKSDPAIEDTSSRVETTSENAETGNESYTVRQDKESCTPTTDINSSELTKLKSKYADDLVARSEFPETIDKEKILDADYEKITDEQLRSRREEFRKVKYDLMAEWERENGREWPCYKDDVYLNGIRQRKAGERYDCHHIHPLNLGGKNEASNITPLHCLDHFDKQGIHAGGSPYSNLQNELKRKEVA